MFWGCLSYCLQGQKKQTMGYWVFHEGQILQEWILPRKYRFGVSLGNFIIVARGSESNTIRHEWGHQRQSLYLGWLYLVVIGLPSVIGNLLNRVIKFDYYRQPWERWADELGGVERK